MVQAQNGDVHGQWIVSESNQITAIIQFTKTKITYLAVVCCSSARGLVMMYCYCVWHLAAARLHRSAQGCALSQSNNILATMVLDRTVMSWSSAVQSQELALVVDLTIWITRKLRAHYTSQNISKFLSFSSNRWGLTTPQRTYVLMSQIRHLRDYYTSEDIRSHFPDHAAEDLLHRREHTFSYLRSCSWGLTTPQRTYVLISQVTE